MSTSNVRITAVLAALALLVGTPSLTTAQEREGFWIGAGTGFGSAAVRCDGCDADRKGSTEGYVRLGWTATDRLLIGGEVNLWAKPVALDEDVMATINLYNMLGTVTFYPSASSGIFVKGGAGLSVVDADVDFAGTDFNVKFGNGLGLLAGVGYDLRVSSRISVTPSVNFWYGRLGDVKMAGETFVENWKHNVVDFTIGITFH